SSSTPNDCAPSTCRSSAATTPSSAPPPAGRQRSPSRRPSPRSSTGGATTPDPLPLWVPKRALFARCGAEKELEQGGGVGFDGEQRALHEAAFGQVVEEAQEIGPEVGHVQEPLRLSVDAELRPRDHLE